MNPHFDRAMALLRVVAAAGAEGLAEYDLGGDRGWRRAVLWLQRLGLVVEDEDTGRWHLCSEDAAADVAEVAALARELAAGGAAGVGTEPAL